MCLDVRDFRLLLAPLKRYGAEALSPDRPAAFQVPDPSGVLVLRGTLRGSEQVDVNGVAHDAISLEIDPGSVARINRREHYRVPTTAKCEFLALGTRDLPDRPREPGGPAQAPGGPSKQDLPALENRPCVLRDVSLGGARLAMASPPPRAGENGLLHMQTGEAGEVLRNLQCTVVQGKASVFSLPFDALVRVRFVSLSPALEARHSRTLTRIQLEMLRTGLRG